MLVNQISWCANILRRKEFRIISYILTQQYIGGNGMRLVDAVYACFHEFGNGLSAGHHGEEQCGIVTVVGYL